ncbi:MAG: hypothetical protein WKF96_24430 [Solirubrobacteraceae bacterium]
MPATPNGSDKLWEAIGCLAAGTEPIHARLTDACHALTRGLNEDDFTGDDLALFLKVRAIWSGRTHGGEMGSLEASVRELDDDSAVAAVRDLLSMLYNLLNPEVEPIDVDAEAARTLIAAMLDFARRLDLDLAAPDIRAAARAAIESIGGGARDDGESPEPGERSQPG